MNLERIAGFKVETAPEILSPTIRDDDGNRPGPDEFIYGERGFTRRQENFYRNLLRLRQILGRNTLPIYFRDDSGQALRMDRGCIDMAVKDGFLAALEATDTGEALQVRFAWGRETGG